MFDLILHMFLQGSPWDNSSTPSVTTAVITDFATEEACRYAGAQSEVASRMLVANNKKVVLIHEFVCVKKKKD